MFHIFHSFSQTHNTNLFLLPLHWCHLCSTESSHLLFLSLTITLHFFSDFTTWYESQVVCSYSHPPFFIALTIAFLFVIFLLVFQKGVCGCAQFFRMNFNFSCLLTLGWINFFLNMNMTRLWPFSFNLNMLIRYVYACDLNGLKNANLVIGVVWLVDNQVT